MLQRLAFVCALPLMVALAPAHALDRPGDVIAGIDPSEMIAAALGAEIELSTPIVGRKGIQYFLMKQDRRVGIITIGVFADRESALTAFELYFRFVGPDKDVSGKIGDKGVGWRESHLVFKRDNAVVSLWLDRESPERAAMAIDSALISGTCGVTRADSVAVPRIEKVEFPEEVGIGEEILVTVTVAVPAGANGDHLAFADRAGMRTTELWPTDPKREVRIVRAFRYRARQAGVEKYWACYATARCVLVSEEVNIAVTAK